MMCVALWVIALAGLWTLARAGDDPDDDEIRGPPDDRERRG